MTNEKVWKNILSMPEQTLKPVTDKISNIEAYCDSYPESEYYTEATELGMKLEERREYLMVSSAHSTFSLRQFLHLYPDSVYAPELRKKLDGLRDGKSRLQENEDHKEVDTKPKAKFEKKWSKQLIWFSIIFVLFVLIIYVGYSLFGNSQKIYTDEIASTLVLVERGSFYMGCTSEQQDCYDWEKPVHRVTLNSYYIGKYEVTQAQWRAVMENNPSRRSGCDQCPVERISWEEVQEFLRRLNAITGQNYRLPTEAEWEFAARGGNKSRGYQYAGSNNLGDVGWYEENSGGKTYPVGQKSPNELGLYDMSGNVMEWCQDRFGGYSSSAQINPTGPLTGSHCVYRGGSWNAVPQLCRVAFRLGDYPGERGGYLGFRLARTP